MAYTTTATSTVSSNYYNYTAATSVPNKINLSDECIDKIAEAVILKLEKYNKLIKDEYEAKPTCAGCAHLKECHYTLKDVPWEDCNWRKNK
ncbi:MAG: hypothetical protein J6Y02_15320 [Pseudobutyrivibrio sp.]|nr:hypothetical protein [Pseudobutyrivibrio sp.]